MATTAAQIAVRLDRLPMTRHIWYLVTLISLGGCFELYDLFLTAYIAPGLNKAGYFTPQSLGVFNVLGPIGVAGIGTFVFALFAGLFVGAICLGHVADHYGRRTVFTFSLVWYSITTAIMAFQDTGFGVNLWRFIAGIGIGVELVTIDTYVAELVPRTHRGRAFAYNQFFQFLAVPIVAFIAYLLVPQAPFGFDGWRWVVLIGSAGAIVIWFIRLGLPESPRWLARHGRFAQAEAVTAAIEAKVAAEAGTLPAPGLAQAQEEGEGSFAEIWQPPYDRRAIILSVFNFFQTFGYYGFAAWVPTLLIAKGITITTSLLYSFVIALANPVGPVLVTLCNNWMSFSFHGYQSELFPTRIRSRAIGFVYSWSRLSAALSGLVVAYLLNLGGVNAVFIFITFAMLMVVVSIGVFGPRTSGLALEAISNA